MKNWKNWLKAALIRAVRTFAEAALAYIGTGALVLGDVNWLAVLSAGAFGFVTALLIALTGRPESGAPFSGRFASGFQDSGTPFSQCCSGNPGSAMLPVAAFSRAWATRLS